MTQILRSGQVVDEFDRPVPGASIYVYNIDGTDASITSDGTSTITQPLSTDEFGNYSYYAVVGYYREDTWYGGKLRFRENNIALGSPGADLALRTDLAASGGSALIEYGGGTVKSNLDSVNTTVLNIGTKNEGTLPASASLTPFVIAKTAAGNASGTSDWRSLIETSTFTGAFGATQINGSNVQHNLFHTAGTVASAIWLQGYAALGVPSTITTTGAVSSLKGIEFHISHTGSGAISSAHVFSAMGPDLDIGTGAIDKFHNYHSDDISGGTGTNRVTTEAYGYFQANSGTSTSIIAGYGSEVSFGTGRWSLYFTGGASNFIAGALRLGGTPTAPTERLEVVGKILSFSQAGVIGGIGYGVGTGGTVTQATSKTTGVTLDKPCGQITLNAAALAANTIAAFTFTNATIAADDDLRVWVKSGNASVGSYRVGAEGNASGARAIVVENKTAGSLSEAIVLGFMVHKAVVS